MKRLLFGLLLVSICCSLTGCSTKYWYKESSTFEQCKADYFACREEMKKYADGGSYKLGGHAEQLLESCMEQKGYRLVKGGNLPLRVKRTGPDTPFIPTERYGLAGLLDE